jgi:hypothetical protein
MVSREEMQEELNSNYPAVFIKVERRGGDTRYSE